MRWEGLFADLEAQAAQLSAAGRDGDVEERTRTEFSQLGLIDRLRPAIGMPVTLRCRGGVSVSGSVRHVSKEWILLAEDAGREALVPITAIATVVGLGRLSAVPNTMRQVESRLGLRHALRGVARDRSAARIFLSEAVVIDGTLDRVGADFIEVAVHAPGEMRRRGDVREVVMIAMAEIVVLRRAS
jgi:hypothetical protein